MFTNDIIEEKTAIPPTEKTIQLRLVQNPHYSYGADQVNKLMHAFQVAERMGIAAVAEISGREWRVQLTTWGTTSRIYDMRRTGLFDEAEDLEHLLENII